MYGKLFTSMYEGSMVGSGSPVFAVWCYCIAKADPDEHTVELNPTLLSAIIGDSKEKIKEAISFLTAPDPDSHCKEHEGSRITHVGGFTYFIVTHEHYREIRSNDDRRAYNREMQRRHRERVKGGTEEDVNDVSMTNLTPASASASVSNSEEGDSQEGEKKHKFNWIYVKDQWNRLAIANGLPSLAKMTEGRKTKYKTRTKQGKTEDVFWQILELELPRLGDFARGGNEERPWHLDFDFVVNSEKNLTRLEEGNYRDKRMTRPAKKKVPQGKRLDLMTREEALLEEEGDA